MSFTSPLFYVALVPAVAALYWLPGRWRAIYLLALSYAFYALSSRVYLVLLIVASASVYALGVAIAKSGSERAKQAYMAAGVAAVVAVIAAFKAAGAWRGLLLPLGVSFYSFKLVSYLIEVYWDDEAVERDPVVFFLFPAFFPQIVSGPIQRPEPFFAQMRDVMGRTLNADQVEMGFRFILGGLMMKTLVGDRLADFIELIDKSHADYSYSIMLTTVACYMLQLYADFSGYTNIALGVGKLFGVEGPPNFNAPFAAVNIQEMWRRWHMSLTLWLTDYLFTPLSMSLRDYGQAGLIGAICLNMIIIGVWHGFTLNYLIFGMLHAVFLSVTVLILGERARRKRAAAGKAKGPQSPRWGPQGGSSHRPRSRVDLCSDELLADLFSFPDVWRGHFHARAGHRSHAERADRMVRHAGLSHHSRLDLHGRCALCRHRRARLRGASEIGQRGRSAVAAIWRLPVPNQRPIDSGNRTFHLWSILTGSIARRTALADP